MLDRGRVVTVVVRQRQCRWRDECQGDRRDNREQGHRECMGHRAVHRGQLASPAPTRAYNSFNTVGASPGKSSLTRPGPNPSAQAA